MPDEAPVMTATGRLAVETVAEVIADMIFPSKMYAEYDGHHIFN
jgi:hypothetical protein